MGVGDRRTPSPANEFRLGQEAVVKDDLEVAQDPTGLQDGDSTDIIVIISKPEPKTVCEDPEYKKGKCSLGRQEKLRFMRKLLF